jgi:hypothetical protein
MQLAVACIGIMFNVFYGLNFQPLCHDFILSLGFARKTHTTAGPRAVKFDGISKGKMNGKS